MKFKIRHTELEKKEKSVYNLRLKLFKLGYFMSFSIQRNFIYALVFSERSSQSKDRNVVLNKKVDDVVQEKWQKKLKLNLMYAKEALEHTLKELPEGAINYRDDMQGVSAESICKLIQLREESTQIANEELKTYDHMDKGIEIQARVAKKYKMGNCGEHAAVAYSYLKNEKNLRKLDYFVLVNGDHAFVIIGKKPLIEAHDYRNFGKSAVACEPWGKTFFPAEQLFEKLNQIAESPLYDPNMHSIGWERSGYIPPEVKILKEIIMEQKTNKLFAANALEILKDRSGDGDKLVKNCLEDYLLRRSKPKIPPRLSETDLKKVEEVYSEYLKGKRQ